VSGCHEGSTTLPRDPFDDRPLSFEGKNLRRLRVYGNGGGIGNGIEVSASLEPAQEGAELSYLLGLTRWLGDATPF